MFEKYLDTHRLEDLVAALPRRPFPAAREREVWEALPETRRAGLRRLAADYRETPYPLLTAGQFMAFGRDGDRAAFEAPYFLRRRKLCAAALGICESGCLDDLGAVIDGIWLICEETGWAVSAHNPPELALHDAEAPCLDLFAAQTAMILTLTCQLLDDALDAASPLIVRRVRREIEARVLRPFEARDDFWWMGFTRRDLCNWTPWIVSNVMLSACAWIEDAPRLCRLLDRGCRMLDRYLETLPADGGCDEGPGYWSMAGGALLDCLELLEGVTGGSMAFWDDEKLRNVLRFPMNAWLCGPWFVNFADCDARPEIPGERLQFAGERLNDPALRAFGACFRGDPSRELDDTPQLWRLLNALFRPLPPESDAIEPPGEVWLQDLQLRVVRSNGMVLACKGGVNEGSHNHNDCGSFILYADGGMQIVDAGNMTYTGKTFSGARYTLWNTRGRYHNVPVIGDMEQVNGWSRRARAVRATQTGMTLDIADAYPGGVVSCQRTFALGEDCRLRDEIRLSAAQPVTEVFLLRHRPKLRENAVVSGDIRIAPEAKMSVGIEEIPIDDPRMARQWPGSLWRVTFTDAPAATHDLKFRIERTPS